MTLEEKREAAIKNLVELGIWKSNAKPPLLTQLWRLGFNVAPPHFGTFWKTAFCVGLPFGFVWSVLMWFIQWQAMGVSIRLAALSALLASTLFGLAMAGYYRYCQKKYKLPSWENFGK